MRRPANFTNLNPSEASLGELWVDGDETSRELPMIPSRDIPANMVEHLGHSLDPFEAFRVFERMAHARLDKMPDRLPNLVECEKLLPPISDGTMALGKNAGDYRVHKPACTLALQSAVAELPPCDVMLAAF
jgi:hypothetical protein